MTERDLRPDDAALSALLDGALPTAEAEAMRRRLAHEPALARRFDELQRVDRTVRAAFAGVADEPVPQRVLDLLRRPAERPRREREVRPPTRWFRPAHAVTASLALAAGFVLAVVLLPRSAPLGPLGLVAEGGEIPAGSPLYGVMQEVATNESRPLDATRSATARLTFINVDGDPCRRVDVAGADGSIETLACRRAGAWRLELVAFGPAAPAAPATNDGVYRPAAGERRSRIDDAIGALIDDAPLGLEAERELILRGWRDAPD